MIFYRIEASMTNMKEIEDATKQRKFAYELAVKNYDFCVKKQKNVFFFISYMREDLVSIGCIMREKQPIESVLKEYSNFINIEIEDSRIEEITLKTIQDMLYSGERNRYVGDTEEVYKMYDLEKFERSGLNFEETIFSENRSKKELISAARTIICEQSLCPEIERIFTGRKVKAVGHPVHYLAISDDPNQREEMVKILHGALYTKGRIENRRMCTVTFFDNSRFSKMALGNLYKSSEGGMIYIKLLLSEEENSDVRRGNNSEFISIVCEIMRKHKNRVLTVFGICRTGQKVKELLFENLGNTSIVEIDEEIVCGEKAKSYLKTLAKNAHTTFDDKLFISLNDDKKGYIAADLNKQFDYWYNEKLKTEIYPQYKEIASVSTQIVKAAPKGSAYDELQKMIGLTEAKKVINTALSYFKAQKLYKDKGLKTQTPSMHMVFTGNPGTAKTTVARLFAQVMKENGILSRGDLYEVGRADLVGQFVGQTAPLVKKRFKEAKGGVLFIDEAYSLVDDRNGMYGDEAINTIVQEMENNREDTVVIFAGYPDKMEEFLNRNPGLKSRIAFHVPFSDYNTAELLQIAELIASKGEIKISVEAGQKLKTIFETALKDEAFGNGRFVRNVLEKSRMKQSERLLQIPFEEVTAEVLGTLLAEDIEFSEAKTEKKLSIGF